MIKVNDLIDDLDIIEREQLTPMFKQINIADFYKCVAEFSGLSMERISDVQMKEYLMTWAKNKYSFFKLLGNKVKLDIPFEYKGLKTERTNEIHDLMKEFPVYYHWLNYFANFDSNKINNRYDLDFSLRQALDELFPQYQVQGSTITHFFKKCLNVPDELITKFSALFENDTVKANFTISIDPTDMMLASENPYDWTSCYRLDCENSDSHADGCMAAVLDSVSLITYVWSKEGKFNLNNHYQFKSIRYKRMRMWIAISKSIKSIHFNAIYPGRSNYDDDFCKKLRGIVEKRVADYLGVEDKWKKGAKYADAFRCYCYGYSEFDSSCVYTLSGEEGETIEAYNEPIKCACGCGYILPGSYHCDCECDSDDIEYAGGGFNHTNFEEKYWCELADDYCPYNCDNCETCCNCECSAWNNTHPVCDLDNTIECSDPDYWYINDGVMESNEEHCSECPHWKACHPTEDDNADDGDEIPTARCS